MYRWLLDTNIIISGLFWSGRESKLLKQAISKKYEAVICEFVLQETKRIIEKKFSGINSQAQPFLEILVNLVSRILGSIGGAFFYFRLKNAPTVIHTYTLIYIISKQKCEEFS